VNFQEISQNSGISFVTTKRRLRQPHRRFLNQTSANGPTWTNIPALDHEKSEF
jgi:hypothetical protein